jgi:hypothetical protein
MAQTLGLASKLIVPIAFATRKHDGAFAVGKHRPYAEDKAFGAVVRANDYYFPKSTEKT